MPSKACKRSKTRKTSEKGRTSKIITMSKKSKRRKTRRKTI